MTEDLDEIGPIDYLVVEFPGNKMTGEGLPLLLDLTQRGIIRVLDLQFLSKAEDGTVTSVSIQDLGGADQSIDLEIFQGAASGILDHSDLSEAANAVEPGNAAAVLVYENTWAAPFAAALRRGGAQVVANGRIPLQALLESLDATEPV